MVHSTSEFSRAVRFVLVFVGGGCSVRRFLTCTWLAVTANLPSLCLPSCPTAQLVSSRPSWPVSARLPSLCLPTFLACVCPACVCLAARPVSAQLPGLCLPSCPACVCPAARPVSAQLPGLCLPSYPACVCPAARPVSAQLPGCPACVCSAARLVSAQLPGLCVPGCHLVSAQLSVLYLLRRTKMVCPITITFRFERTCIEHSFSSASKRIVCEGQTGFNVLNVVVFFSLFLENMASNCASYTPCNIDVSDLTATDLESFLLSISFDPSIAAKLKEII
ncbi:hypothetical protein OUZ56_017715 [Daphnia magna]|uniref:Uncharacterized protein n=1 Tax=Daphnia magna TaxID=35525 RepID=A0ABR0ATH5_9CRUS|nr:hypothetical protein OUZ56_017715 [Daphnia magna]